MKRADMPPKATYVRYEVMSFLFIAAAISYLCRQAVGVAESEIRNSLSLSLEQSGYLMSAFFATYSLLQLPSGAFSQRVGTRISLSLFAVGWSVACAATGFASGLIFLILAQAIMGISQAGIFPASCGSINYWMPISKRSFACGLLAAGMQFGAIISAVLTGYLLEQYNWRNIFWWYSIPGFLWTAIFFYRFRDRPEDSKSVNQSEIDFIHSGLVAGDKSATDSDKAAVIDWGKLLTNSQIWLLCGQQVCRASAYMFFASWFPTFLQQTRGLSVANSGYIQGLVLSGTLIGSLIGGLLTDWIFQKTGSIKMSRGLTGGVSLGTCGILILCSFFVRDISLATGLLSLGALFAAVAGPCTLATTIDISGSRVPQIYGLVNMTGNIAATACPIIVGKIFANSTNWEVVIGLFAVIYLVGAVCWLAINPNQKVPLKSRSNATIL